MIKSLASWALGNWVLVALGAAIVAVPLAYKAGKIRQSYIDEAAYKIEDARKTSEAYAAADRASRQIIEEQQRRAEEARGELDKSKQALTLAEEEARVNDERADKAEAERAAAEAKASPSCPPAVVRSCSSLPPGDIDELRRKYPAGPLRRPASRRAAP